MVVGFGRGDAPNYAREGVALHGTPSTLGGHYRVNHINYDRLGIFQETRFRRVASEAHHLVC